MSQRFALLVPVKLLTLAKSRLEVTGAAGRAPMMRAFATDALAAARGASRVARIYVVTDEDGFDEGAVRLGDAGDGDLNRALVHAERQVRLREPDLGVAAMCADLPALRAEDLDAALAAGLSPRWFVADADGTGTTLLAAGPGVALDPHFGPGSARRHEESGAVPVRAEVTTLRRDVDTSADLADARELGVGVHTERALNAP
jgi:2-phospho-L-lactate guanylyltransferase